MKFTDIFVRRPVLACVMSLLLILVGLVSFNRLTLREYPRLAHGGAHLADPARDWRGDLVQRALAQIQAGGLAAAQADFHSRDKGYVDRDLYVFIVDRQGVYRLHGAKPAMEGQHVQSLPGINGDAFMAVAARLPLRVHATRYALADANRALADLREGRVSGAAVLLP